MVLSNQFQAKDYLFAYSMAFQHALHPLIDFDIQNFEEKLQKSGWKTNHLQMNTLGWKGNFV